MRRAAALLAVLAMPVLAGAANADAAALQPVPRADTNSMLAHQQLLHKAHTGRIDLYFLGDSITRRWGATDYPQLLDHWNASFHGWNAANFGWGGDKVANILWRVQNGELDGVNPHVIVLMAGTNDVGNQLPSDGMEPAATRIAAEIEVLVNAVRAKAPQATVILMGILPRGDNPAVMPVINAINQQIAQLAGGQVTYLNINDRFVDNSGRLLPELVQADQLHLALPGYRVWVEALQPQLMRLLGPRAPQDMAPPPTGDPAKR